MTAIPPNAKRVFKGEIFEIYQWPQKMFDGTTATFEMAKRPDTVLIIATIGKKILVTKEEQPNFKRDVGFPGGKVDEGEEPLQAAQRELLEETGMQSADWELLKAYEPLTRIDWKIYFYIARNCQKIQEPNLENGERIETSEVDFDEFIRVMAAQNWGEFTNDLLRLKLEDRLDELKTKLFPNG